MTDTRRRSPLAHRQPIAGSGGQFALAEIPFRGVISLRGTRASLTAPVEGAIGLTLPGAVGETTATETATALWLAPDEWVLVTPGDAASATLTSLENAFATLHAQVVDVSDYYTTIAVTGRRTRDGLAKLTAVDLHPNFFPVGMAVATRFAKGTAWIHCAEAGDTGDAFHLIVRRSYADYFWCLLADAGREWDMPAQTPIG